MARDDIVHIKIVIESASPLTWSSRPTVKSLPILIECANGTSDSVVDNIGGCDGVIGKFIMFNSIGPYLCRGQRYPQLSADCFRGQFDVVTAPPPILEVRIGGDVVRTNRPCW